MPSTATASGGSATANIGGRPVVYPLVPAGNDVNVDAVATLGTVGAFGVAFAGDAVMLTASVDYTALDGTASSKLAWWRGTVADPGAEIANIPIPDNDSGDPASGDLSLDFTDFPGDAAGVVYRLRATIQGA